MNNENFDGNNFGTVFGVVVMLIYVIAIYLISTCNK